MFRQREAPEASLYVQPLPLMMYQTTPPDIADCSESLKGGCMDMSYRCCNPRYTVHLWTESGMKERGYGATLLQILWQDRFELCTETLSSVHDFFHRPPGCKL